MAFIFISSIILFMYTNRCQSRLPSQQIFALREFYNSLNGDSWTNCNQRWNFTEFGHNGTLSNNFCGLEFENVTNDIQTVISITFADDNYNLNGIISFSIYLLSDLTQFILGINPLFTGNVPYTIANVYGHIPETICNLKHLKVFHLWELNISGSIPECIGNELTNLTDFELGYLQYLNSTIPASFNNLTKLKLFVLEKLPLIHGPISDELISNNDFIAFAISNVSVSGKLCMACLCANNTFDRSLQHVYIGYLDKMIINISECQHPMTQLIDLWIDYSELIIGTIPTDLVCSSPHFHTIVFTHTSITGTIPQCMLQHVNLTSITLSHNHLNGPLPALLRNDTLLQSIDFSNNALTGDITTLLPLNGYTNLEQIILHTNQLHDDDITGFIHKLFAHSPNLRALTLYNNSHLSGDFPVFESEVSLKQLEILAMQNLDISGTLPHNLYLGDSSIDKTFYIMIYGNRLSSTLPKKFIQHLNVTPIALTGNLFTINTENEIPEWMKNSKFVNEADQLYIHSIDLMTNGIVLCIGFVCFILVLIKQKYNFFHLRHSDIAFIEDIKRIELFLNDQKLLFVTFLLLCVYPFITFFIGSYYASPPILSFFCLYFFDKDSIIIQSILCLLIVCYNFVSIEMITNIIKNTFNHSYQIKEEIIISNNDYVQMIDLNVDNIKHRKQTRLEVAQRKCKNRCLCATYLILYFVSILFLLLYILSESLPNDNVLQIQDSYRKLLSFSIYFIMAVNTSVITPKFVNSILTVFNLSEYSNKSRLIMILRTLSTIIIPLICSFVLQSNCGNGWVLYWNPCVYEKESFDMSSPVVSNTNYNYSYVNHVVVSSKESVCSVVPFWLFNWNKCLRTFLFKWCNVLMIKMIIMFFMPPFIILIKMIKDKLSKTNQHRIVIDSEFSMIVTKMEYVLAFGIFCPLIYPVIIVSLNSFITFYQYALNTLKWDLVFTNYERGRKSFPFRFLVFGIAIQQLLTIGLMMSVHNEKNTKAIPFSLLFAFISMDVRTLYKLYLCR